MFKEIILMNLICFISGSVGGWLSSRTKRLKKKGYSEKRIKIQKKMNLIAVLYMIPLFFILQLIMGIIISANIGLEAYLDEYHYTLNLVMIVLIPLIIPLIPIQNRLTSKIANEPGENITIDFNFKSLKQFFNPFFELLYSLVLISIVLLIMKDIKDVYAFILLLEMIWFIAIYLRFIKNEGKSALKDTYRQMWIVTYIYQILLFTLFLLNSISSMMNSISLLKILAFSIGTILTIVKFIYYLLRKKKYSQIYGETLLNRKIEQDYETNKINKEPHNEQ